MQLCASISVYLNIQIEQLYRVIEVIETGVTVMFLIHLIDNKTYYRFKLMLSVNIWVLIEIAFKKNIWLYEKSVDKINIDLSKKI